MKSVALFALLFVGVSLLIVFLNALIVDFFDSVPADPRWAKFRGLERLPPPLPATEMIDTALLVRCLK